VLQMLFEILNILVTAAVATYLGWLISAKRNGHDEQDRDR
jgi:hypothetical protein